MGLSDDLREREMLTGDAKKLHDGQAVKAWTDFYHKDNLVDFYLEKSGYKAKEKNLAQKQEVLEKLEQAPRDTLAVKTWLKWCESGDKVKQAPIDQSELPREIKKAVAQAKEIKTRQGLGEEESLAVRTWLEWYESGDHPDNQESQPVIVPSSLIENKKAAAQAKEIKTRQGVSNEESLAIKTWLEWYESGDDPANHRPVEKKADPRPDVRAKEVKTRMGVREEEAMALKAFTDIYNAGDFLDAYLEKSGY